MRFPLTNKFLFFQTTNIASPQLDRASLATACEALKLDKLCDQDFAFLTEFNNIIKPIADAITFLEGDVKTFGSYLPMLFSVRQTLKDLYINNDLEFCRPLLIAVRDGFDKRFGHLMSLGNVFEKGNPKAIPLFLAMLSNPEYKMNFIPHYWFHQNANGFNQIKSLLLSAMKQQVEYEKKSNENGSMGNDHVMAEIPDAEKKGILFKIKSYKICLLFLLWQI